MLAVGHRVVLSQNIEEEEHPVLYLSRKLFLQECNYLVIEKEALAIKWVLKAIWYYLLGRPLVIVSNHAPLKWL